jgi:hypothetical protein
MFCINASTSSTLMVVPETTCVLPTMRAAARLISSKIGLSATSSLAESDRRSARDAAAAAAWHWQLRAPTSP